MANNPIRRNPQSEISMVFHSLIKVKMSLQSMEDDYNNDWNLFMQAVTEEDRRRISEDDFWRFLVEFGRCIEKHDTTDATTVGVMELAWRSYSNFMAHKDRLMWCWKARSAGFKNVFFKPYKKTYNSGNYHVDAVTPFVLFGIPRPLERLLRFGATPAYPKDEKCELRRCIAIVKILFPKIEYRYRYVDDIKQSLVEQFDETARRRLFLVCRCLDILPIFRIQTRGISEKCQKRVACWRLYFKAVPEPFVTGEEVLHKFKRLLWGRVKDEEIEAVVQEFQEYFPESCQPSGPRSLKHLSRFQVRENLRASSFAPHLLQGIDALPVPRLIKEYISLKEDGTPPPPPDPTPLRFAKIGF